MRAARSACLAASLCLASLHAATSFASNFSPNSQRLRSQEAHRSSSTVVRSSSPFSSRALVVRLFSKDNAMSSESNEGNLDHAQSPSLWHSIVTLVGSSTSAVVSVTFFVAFAYQRDALMVSFWIGGIANALLSKTLKKIIKQERPADLAVEDLLVRPSVGGMPSSHAMSLGFIGTFTALTLPWTWPYLMPYIAISLIYRVDSKLHTWEQIGVGLSVGTLNAFLWKKLCEGDNPLGINLVDLATKYLMNGNAKLPMVLLLVPLIVGGVVIGAFQKLAALIAASEGKVKSK